MEKTANQFTLNIVSPENLLYSQKVDMAIIPGETGDFGVLPQHEALISTISPGVVTVYENGKIKEQIFVGGGFTEVSDDICTVLADEVIFIKDINLKDLEQYVKDTRENIDLARSDEEKANLHSDLRLANAKLEIAKRLKGH